MRKFSEEEIEVAVEVGLMIAVLVGLATLAAFFGTSQ